MTKFNMPDFANELLNPKADIYKQRQKLSELISDMYIDYRDDAEWICEEFIEDIEYLVPEDEAISGGYTNECLNKYSLQILELARQGLKEDAIALLEEGKNEILDLYCQNTGALVKDCNCEDCTDDGDRAYDSRKVDGEIK